MTILTPPVRPWPMGQSWHDRVASHTGDVEFIIKDILPRGLITTLFGRDGIGKSTLVMYLGMCVAIGRCPFTHDELPPRKFWFFSSEDPEKTIVARYLVLQENLMLAPTQYYLLEQNFVMPNLQGQNATLSRGNRFRIMLDEALPKYRPDVICFDPITDFFTGNQNASNEVGKFLRDLEKWAMTYDAAVMLLGHPAKDEESKYAGHTLWSAKSRSRLFLYEDKNGLWLDQPKRTTGGPEMDPIKLKRDSDGAIWPMTEADHQQDDQNIIRAISQALPRWAEAGQTVSLADTAKNNIGKLLAAETSHNRADIIRIAKHLEANGTIGKVVCDGTNGTPELRGSNRQFKSSLLLLSSCSVAPKLPDPVSAD